jgi:cytochrome c-type biogenesis protein
MSAVTELAGAFVGGLVSFASPCVLPLVPAYLSLVTGLNVSSIHGGGRRHLRQVLWTAGGFVTGFTAVFVILGLTVTAAGQLLAGHRVLLTRISGLVVLAMALFLVGAHILDAPWLYQERRWRPNVQRFGRWAAPAVGVAFGFGWTPCIGPVLTSVLAVAATSGRAAEGTALLLAYSAGLALPFLVAALALDRVSGALGVIKRHLTGLTLASAGLLAVLGALLALGLLPAVTAGIEGIFAASADNRAVPPTRPPGIEAPRIEAPRIEAPGIKALPPGALPLAHVESGAPAGSAVGPVQSAPTEATGEGKDGPP